MENPKVYNPDIASILCGIGNNYYVQKNYAIAVEHYIKCLGIYQDLAIETPTYVTSQIPLYSNIYNSYNYQKKYDLAIIYSNQKIELIQNNENLINNYTNELSMTYSRLASFYIFDEKFNLSELSARKSLVVDSTQVGAKTNLAATLLFQGKYQEAEAIYLELKNKEYAGQDKTYGDTCLKYLAEFEKANVIPEERKLDVKKIKKLLRE